MVLFGSSAPFLSDINLILQYITLVLLVIGYIKRKPFKTHGYLMIIVLLITVGTTLAIMAPALLIAFSVYGYLMLAHAAIGTIAMILGCLFAIRFILAVRNQKPLTCGTKTMMRLALILWVMPMLSGTIEYVILYL
jgi:predicted ferric reductase